MIYRAASLGCLVILGVALSSCGTPQPGDDCDGDAPIDCGQGKKMYCAGCFIGDKPYCTHQHEVGTVQSEWTACQ